MFDRLKRIFRKKPAPPAITESPRTTEARLARKRHTDEYYERLRAARNPAPAEHYAQAYVPEYDIIPIIRSDAPTAPEPASAWAGFGGGESGGII